MAEGLDLIRPDWPAPARVRAVATGRAGGVSRGRYASLNLGDHVGDDPDAVAENRRRLERALQLPEPPRWLRQVHGTAVLAADRAGPVPEADAMVAAAAGQVCALLTADCLPVLFCDCAGTRVAAAHAGWRGLAAGILEATVNTLAGSGVAARDLLVWLGPAISGPAYEVGTELREAFVARTPNAAAAFSANPRGRWQFDLVAFARQQLAALGVRRIYGGDCCTYSDAARFFSHRRDGRCGRQATLIWVE